MTVSFHSFGCKVNQYETQLLRENFSLKGFEIGDEGKAQISVVNSCCVTAKAEKECRNLLNRLGRQGKEIWLTGCLVKKAENQLLQLFPRVKIFDRQFLLNFILSPGTPIIRNFAGHTRAFVKIEEGCENFCSYCIVPLVRGPVKSRPEKEILEEIGCLTENGYKEIILTGTDLAAYGRDTGTDLLGLLKKIFRQPDLGRVRLSSLELFYVTDDLVKFLSEQEKFCPHFHIPLQSGSDRILKLMARRYTTRNYLNTINRIRKFLPSVTFTTDVMVGFPGEQDADWLDTYKAVEKSGFLKVHIFRYSSRPGTDAERLPNYVPESVKKSREKQLFQLADEVSRKEQSRFLDTIQEVLVERKIDGDSGREWFGHTANYLPVILQSQEDIKNAIIPVKLKNLIKKGTGYFWKAQNPKGGIW